MVQDERKEREILTKGGVVGSRGTYSLGRSSGRAEIILLDVSGEELNSLKEMTVSSDI